MKKGDCVFTPRFCTVRIEKVFKSYQTARKQGYVEPTHYKWEHCDGYDIVGKSLDLYHMKFAAVKL